MKFYNYINELFDSDIKVYLDYFNKKFLTYRFDVDYKEFSVEIFKDKYNNYYDNIYIITFFDENEQEEITGLIKKDVFKVFSGIIKSIKDFIKKINPDYFQFSAKEKSRIQLYDKFIKLIEKETNYKLIKTEIHGDKNYIFKRKNNE